MGGNKKGAGAKGKKKKEQEDKDVLSEVDKEYYEIQIADLNRKLTRQRNRTAELEKANKSLEEQLKIIDDDRSDIIAYLRKMLVAKTSEIKELHERLEGLKQSMDHEIITYKSKVGQMEVDHKNLHEELTSEIKLLMGKLNSLEEFRTQREELMTKFSIQEQRLEEMKKLRQTTLYECERQFVLKKEKLQQELEKRLKQLSDTFRQFTDIRIASTTHRLIKENIFVSSELEATQNSHKELLTAYDSMKCRLKETEVELKLKIEESNQIIRKSLRQKKVIEELRKEKDQLKDYSSNIIKLTEERDKIANELQQMKEKLNDANKEISILNDKLCNNQTNAAKLFADIAALKLNSRRLDSLLQRAVHAVKEAIKLKTDSSGVDEGLISSRRDDLLNNLLQLLDKAASLETTEHYGSSEEMSIIGHYKVGDLGFVAKY